MSTSVPRHFVRSPAMIRAGFEVAQSADTPFHIHAAEGQYEGARTLTEHGATPVRYLTSSACSESA